MRIYYPNHLCAYIKQPLMIRYIIFTFVCFLTYCFLLRPRKVMTAVTGFSGSSLRDECLCTTAIVGRQPAAAESAAVADATAAAPPPSQAGRQATTVAVHSHNQQHFVVHAAAAHSDIAPVAPQRRVSFQRSISAGSIPAGRTARRTTAGGHHQLAVMVADGAGGVPTCQCKGGVPRSNGGATASATAATLQRPTPQQRITRMPGLLRRLQLWRWRYRHARHGKRAAAGGFYSPPTESARCSLNGLQSLLPTDIHPPVIQNSSEHTVDTMVSVSNLSPHANEIEIRRSIIEPINESDGLNDELTVYVNELRMREQS